jgi:hypothetical protein
MKPAMSTVSTAYHEDALAIHGSVKEATPRNVPGAAGGLLRDDGCGCPHFAAARQEVESVPHASRSGAETS